MGDKKPGYFPRSRISGLVTESIGDELVVYDGETTNAHCLAPLAAAVFQTADGQTSLEDIASGASVKLGEPVSVGSVELALAELQEFNLIEASEGSDGVSRREVLRRGAMVGGAAVVTPALVASLATPAYGSGGSAFGHSVSYVALFFEVGNCNYYREKFGSSTSEVCGFSWADPGNCGGYIDHPPTGGTKESGCLPGVSVTQNLANNTLTVTWPKTYNGQTVSLLEIGLKCKTTCTQVTGYTVTASGSNWTTTFAGCV